MRGGARGVCKGTIVNELISHGLCAKGTGEPWRVLSRGGIVSSLYLGSPSGCCVEDLTPGWEDPKGSCWPWGSDGENIKGYLGGDGGRIFLLPGVSQPETLCILLSTSSH